MQFWKSNLMLLSAAIIWGFAFVYQIIGMEHLGPFSFNGLRFILGALSLVPVMLLLSRNHHLTEDNEPDNRWLVRGGVVAGVILFIASNFQQVGLQYTTAGKAGFITGLYILFVPVIGLFMKQLANTRTWVGAFIALIGLYFLCIKDDLVLAYGDALQLAGALFWAAHVVFIGWVSPRVNAIRLSIIQFLVCGALCLIVAVIREQITLHAISQAIVPLAYAGILSVGVAYTFQVIAQRDAKASHAAIIMSTEAAFAALGGWWLLNEEITSKMLVGCVLMLFGMIISQLPNKSKKPESSM